MPEVVRRPVDTTTREKLAALKQPLPRPRTPILNFKESAGTGTTKSSEDEKEKEKAHGLGVRKKGLGVRSWLRFDLDGHTSTLESDKYGIMKRVLIPARDLRILDPLLSYPSTILGRERAIVVNLEEIKAIITAEEVLLLNAELEKVTPFIEELKKRLPVHFNSLGQQVAGDGGGGLSDNDEDRSGAISPSDASPNLLGPDRTSLSEPPSPNLKVERPRSPLGRPLQGQETIVGTLMANAKPIQPQVTRNATAGAVKSPVNGTKMASATPLIKEAGDGHDKGTNGENSLWGQRMEGPNALPFEFRALEVCLEAACHSLDAETVALEKEAYPALDQLTSRISTLNLERVRRIKSKLVAISGRVHKVRDEIERLLDDDGDMAEMYLTDKMVKEAAAMEETRNMLSPLVSSFPGHSPHTTTPPLSPTGPRAGNLSRSRAGRPSLVVMEDDNLFTEHHHEQRPGLRRRRSSAKRRNTSSPQPPPLSPVSDATEEEPEEKSSAETEVNSATENSEEDANSEEEESVGSGARQGRKSSSTSTSSTSTSSSSSSSSGDTIRAGPEILDVEELEMLLEAYFVQIDGSLNKLLTLREYVDDTEDFINIMLDDQQNHLLQMGVLVTTATLVISMYVVVVGFFGMNVEFYLFSPAYAWTFYWIVGGCSVGSVIMCAAVIGYCRYKRLIGF